DMDAEVQDVLMKLQRYGNSFGQSAKARAKWTKDLGFPVKDARQEPVEYLWFVGDYASFDPRALEITKKTAEVLHALGIDFGLLYEKEKNAGNDARRIGEEGLFEMLRDGNLQELESAQFQTILTTDPHTYHVLKNEYGFPLKTNGESFSPPILHYTELFERLMTEGRIPSRRPLDLAVTYHDPCYLGRYNGIFESPRRVLSGLGAHLVEMPQNRADSFCCGAGGGRIWMKDLPGVTERPAARRIREALDLPDVPVFVTACPKDYAMFGDALKTVGAEERLRVADVSELVHEAMAIQEQETVTS
ncbi:MAG TPA: (Fe-S)-binding protein, partial [bacterium]|nr:(Fe-S)-binding protein [bacterium]